jgi:hypothetical protein
MGQVDVVEEGSRHVVSPYEGEDVDEELGGETVDKGVQGVRG